MLGTEPQIEAEYVASGQVQLVFNPVLNHGDRSLQAHQAAECAGDQNQFWAFRDYLFEHHTRLWQGDIRLTLKTLAEEFGLDSPTFNACLDEQKHAPTVQAQDQIRRGQGITNQPVFDINGLFLIGNQPFSNFQATIDSFLTP